MPSIKDSTNPDLSGYTPVAPTATPAPASAPAVQEEPARNPFLRTPLPSLNPTSPDSLRQWFNGGAVPQNRILPLPSLPVNAGNLTDNNSIFIAGGGSGGGGSSTVNINSNPNDTFNNTYLTSLYSQQVVVTTPQITPGNSWQGVTLMSQSFQMLGFAASSACRVRLYSTAASQNADYARGLDDPPPAGTIQGLIFDVAVDTVPLQWQFAGLLGSNGDDPALSNIYVTIENLSPSSAAITLSLQYVPMSQGSSPNNPTISVGNSTISNTELATFANLAQLSGAQFTGPIGAYTVVTGQVDAVNINATGSTTLTDVAVSGNLTTADLTISGSLALTDISANDITTVGMTVTGSTVANNISASGDISGLTITASDSLVTNTLSATGTITVNEVISGAVNSPIVNVSSSSAGLTINGSQISSSALSDSANLPTLSGANVFTNSLSALSLSATDSGVVSVFAGPVSSASISTTDASSVSTFLGEVSGATFTQSGSSAVTFNGPVNLVDLVSTGGTTLVTINGTDQTGIGANANNTLDKVITQKAFGPASSISGYGVLTVFTFTVTANSTSDVFNLQAAVSAAFPVSDTLQLYGYVDGSTRFGYGQATSQNSTYPQSVQFFGSVTGLTAGSHTITLTTFSGGVFSTSIIADTCYALLQQIAS